MTAGDARGLVKALVTARVQADTVLEQELMDEAMTSNPRSVMAAMIDWVDGVIVQVDPVSANRDSMAVYLADLTAATLESAGEFYGNGPVLFWEQFRSKTISDSDPLRVAGDLVDARVRGNDPGPVLAGALVVGMADVLAGLCAWLRLLYDILAKALDERGLIDFLLGSIDEVLESLADFTGRDKRALVAGMWLAEAAGEG